MLKFGMWDYIYFITKNRSALKEHSDNIIYCINYIKLFASARISSPIASAASCVGPSE